MDVIKGMANVVSVSSQSLDVINMALQALAALLEYGKPHKATLSCHTLVIIGFCSRH